MSWEMGCVEVRAWTWSMGMLDSDGLRWEGVGESGRYMGRLSFGERGSADRDVVR